MVYCFTVELTRVNDRNLSRFLMVIPLCFSSPDVVYCSNCDIQSLNSSCNATSYQATQVALQLQ